MKKPGPRRDRYFLRDLHQEIDLYDRKLAYLNNYVEFASPGERKEAEKSLLPRELLWKKPPGNLRHLALNSTTRTFHDPSARRLSSKTLRDEICF